MGGRGTVSRMRSRMTYTEYNSVEESESGLGYGNGGETDRWQLSLTNDEYKAVERYSLSGYTYVNKPLRKGEPFSNKEYEKLNQGLESALNKFELKEPTTFIRGSSPKLLGGAGTVEEINAMVGKVVMDLGYTSSSATIGGSFAGIKYHINTPAGKGIGAYIRGISEFGAEENEFLFNRGSMFKITGAYKDSYDGVHCNLEYVGRQS